MQRLLALFLACVLFVNAAFAGVNRNKSRYVGGTTKGIPVPSVGVLDTTGQTLLAFNYEPGKAIDKSKFAAGTFSLPYPEITAIGYGQHASLRVGETIALSALAGVGGLLLLLSKSKSHYVTIEYKDAEGNAQSIVFEIGKDAIRPLLTSLATRTGETVVDQPDPTKTNKQLKK